LVAKGGNGTASYDLLSFAKGANPDARESGLGYVWWQDLNKVMKVPQFQYATVVLDKDNTLVCKSNQEDTLDLRPIIHAAPGVDLPSVIVSCIPFLPDGSTKVWAAVDLATWFDFF
jgi:hypothetical protein